MTAPHCQLNKPKHPMRRPPLPTAVWAEEEGETPTATVTEATTASGLTDAVAAGGTVKLMLDIAISESLSVDRTVTLDLNGKVLKMTGSGSAIKVESNGDLTLMDSAPTAEHKFTPDENGLWVLDESNGTETVSGGVITGGTGTDLGNSPHGGGVYIVSGQCTMTGGNIVGCTASGGGGVFTFESYVSSNNCTFTLDGGSIVGCTATFGSGIYVNSGGASSHIRTGIFTFTSGRIRDCKSNSHIDNALYLYGTMNANGGTVDGPVRSSGTIITKTGYKGTIFSGSVTNSGTIKGGIFDDTVTNSGGTISGGTFNDTVASVFYPEWNRYEDIKITGLGTNERPYELDTVEKLKVFRDIVNGTNQTQNTDACAVLTADIDLDSEAWTPIGNSSSKFTGTFDGQGHIIKDLFIDPNSTAQGLFGWIQGGTIKNFEVTGTITKQSGAAGGIVGLVKGGVVENCVNRCDVSTSDYAGGIAGYLDQGGTIRDCYNLGTISGRDYLGGIVGIINSPNGNVYNCYNVGAVQGNGKVGEIAGQVGGIVTNCYFLTGAANQGIGFGSGEATAKTAAEFADGTVLNALIHGRADGQHPWDTDCGSKTLSEGSMRLPVLAWQGLATKHTGDTATCKDKAVCDYCGQPYGDMDPANHTNLVNVPAQDATTSADGNIEYWHCEGCGKYFSDADAKTEITQAETVIPKRQSSGGGGSRGNSYAVSTPKADNGTVTINNGSTAKRGDTVSITVKPDAGYEIGTVTVTDSKGNNISLTDKGDGKFSFTMPDGKVDVKATFVKSEPEQPGRTGFVDVPEGIWYEDAAGFVARRGLMSGVGENLFGGNQNTTRAMLMTILARMDGQDVSGGATWYEKGMNWAKNNGVSDGTMPTANITREQLATMLYSYAKLRGIDTTQGGMAVREFSDYDSISDWAGQSMTWAVNAGILSGRGNNTLAPTAGATRAEMAVMLQQFVGLMEK